MVIFELVSLNPIKYSVKKLSDGKTVDIKGFKKKSSDNAHNLVMLKVSITGVYI